jgi:hypothetical protein
LSSEGKELGRRGASQFVTPKVKHLLGKHHDAASLWGIVRKGSKLGDFGQFSLAYPRHGDKANRLTIAEKKASIAAQKAESWLQQQQQQVAQAQAAQQRTQQGQALVQWQESTVTNFVEAYAKQAGLTSKEAKYHAWNAGFAAMMSNGGGRESVQAVNKAVADAIRSLRTHAAPARQTPAVPASTSVPTRSTVSAPNSNAPRKSVRDMNKSEFDTGVMDWLERNTF